MPTSSRLILHLSRLKVAVPAATLSNSAPRRRESRPAFELNLRTNGTEPAHRPAQA